MPANTQLVRNGKPVVMPNGWGMWHVQVLHEAALSEDPTIDDPAPEGESPRFFGWFPNNPSTYVFKKAHTFEDTSDGEIFHILPGDEWSAWR